MPELDHYLTILYSALRSRLGIAVATTNPQESLRDFARAKALDAELSPLRIVPSRTNPNGEVWILKPSLEDQP